MAQTIIYGETGQTLRHVPPARVTSATYAIEDLTLADDDADRVIASGAATVATWSVTSTATAGATQANAARVSTSSTTGATVGAPAAIVAADGTAEIFEVAAVSANSYIEAETELAGVYPSGSVVYGIEVTAAVPNTLAADEDVLEQARPLRVVWTYTVGGATLKVQERIEFLRHTTAATVDVGAAILRVRKLYPDLPERLPERASLDTIATGLAEEIEDELRQRKIPPERLMLGPAGEQILAMRIVAHAGELGYAPGSTPTDGAWAARALDRYRQRLEALVIGEPGLATTETTFVADTATSTPSEIYRGPTLRM